MNKARYNILNVPHIKQINVNSCGAAVLAMIYQFWGIKDTQEDIWKRLQERREIAKGLMIKVNKIIEDAKSKNLRWFVGNALWQDRKIAFDPIEQFLQSGIPLIVCQRVERRSKLGHFRTVVGLDSKWIYINDPLKTKMSIMSRNKFLALWQKASKEIPGGLFIAIFKNSDSPKLKRLRLSGFQGALETFEVGEIEWH